MNFYIALPVQGIDPPSPPRTVANTLGFLGHSLLVETSQLCYGRMKTDVETHKQM